MVFPTPSVRSRRARLLAGPSALLLLAAGLVAAAPLQADALVAPAPAPALQISSVQASGTPTNTGTKVSTTFVVKNRTGGRKPATKAKLYLVSQDGERTYGLGEAQVPATAPGTKTPVTTFATATLNAPEGRYAVRVCLAPRPDGNCRDSRPSVVIQPARLVAAPSSVAFGEAPVGSSADEKTVTITNRGHARSGTLELELTGDDAFSTSAIVECGPTLAPGASCEVGLTFSPDSVGPASGTLVVTGRRGASVSVPLSGTGTGDAALAISPSSAEFDDTLVGATSDPVTFTVSSVGLVPTGIPDASLGSESGDFDITNDTCTAPLPPGATCTVTVVFTPGDPGEATDELTVSATPGGSASADLSGTGLAPASLSLTPPSAAFGSEIVGDTSEPTTFTLTNSGDVASGAPTVVLGGIDADQFTIVSNGCTAAIPADGTCTIDVAFAPNDIGSASASLDVSATPGGTDTSPLTGTGETSPVLTISETSYDYGFTDSPTEHTFTITNTGTQATGTPVVDTTGSNAFQVTTNTCTAPLAGGGTCTVGVTYTGSGTGEQSGQLTVSATPGGAVSADLTGSPEALTVAPTSHDYGGVLVGSSSGPVSYTLTNHRLTAVQIDGEGVTGPFPLDSSCFQEVLPAGGTCTFSAHFAPTNPGSVSGFLDYFAEGGFARVEVSGVGLTPAAFSVSPSTVDFGAYAPGDIGTQQVTVTNTGTQASSTISFSITGTDAIEFYTDSTDCPTTLAGGASCTVTVGFAPFTLGDKTATFTVAGAPGGSTSLVGLGAPAGVTLYPATHDYGPVAVGGAAYFTFRVVNTTDNAEDMNSASSGPPFPLELSQDFTCVIIISTIQPHRWCTMTLSFKPQSVGSFSTTLTAGGTSFNTQSQLFGTGVPARPTLRHGDPDAVSKPQAYSLVLRHGQPVVRRE